MSPDYAPNVQSNVKVTIDNVTKISMREKKQSSKVYTTYSGYPSGLKRETFAMLKARKGEQEAIRRAVLRMLPNNRLRNDRMKNLTISS
jgi:large subunit ribosomal protein L13